jgi:hypothetical protein
MRVRGALNRARDVAACHGATDVAFGLEFGRPDYVAKRRAGVMAERAARLIWAAAVQTH